MNQQLSVAMGFVAGNTLHAGFYCAATAILCISQVGKRCFFDASSVARLDAADELGLPGATGRRQGRPGFQAPSSTAARCRPPVSTPRAARRWNHRIESLDMPSTRSFIANPRRGRVVVTGPLRWRPAPRAARPRTPAPPAPPTRPPRAPRRPPTPSARPTRCPSSAARHSLPGPRAPRG